MVGTKHSWRKLAREERAPLPKGTQKEKSHRETSDKHTLVLQLDEFMLGSSGEIAESRSVIAIGSWFTGLGMMKREAAGFRSVGWAGDDGRSWKYAGVRLEDRVDGSAR